MKPDELARLRAIAGDVRWRFHRTRTTMDLPISGDAAQAFSYDVPAALDHIARLEDALRAAQPYVDCADWINDPVARSVSAKIDAALGEGV